MPEEYIPKRTNLVEEAVRAMRARLRAGEWTEFLPGERELAKRLQIGRDTVRLVLASLEKSGHLLPAERGKRRRISPKGREERSESDEKPPEKIGVLAPYRFDHMSQPVLLEIDQVREALAARGTELQLFVPRWYQQQDPTSSLKKLVEESGCKSWILFRSSLVVQRWFAESGLPCLIRGYPHEGIELPFMDVNWAATARHAASRLWRLGHRRVGVILPSEGLSGVRAALEGTQSTGEPDFEIIPMHEDGSSEGLARCLKRGLQVAKPPTALIALRARQVAGTLSWLGQHRIRVPQEMSLISLVHEPFIDYLFPSISGYQMNSNQVAKRVLRKLDLLAQRSGAKSNNSSWIEPEPIEGKSIREPFEG